MQKFFASAMLAYCTTAVTIEGITGYAKPDEAFSDNKCGLDVRGPIEWVKAGTTIENVIIYMPPDHDFDKALMISQDNITLRNVVIYHPANRLGLYSWKAKNLVLDNVEVIAYGNEWGAAPCPSRSPFNGANCSNIAIYGAENLKITNTRVENGSKGIYIVDSPDSLLQNVVAKNVRGPFPGGQCFQIATSDNTVVDGFHCLNELDKSWPEDSISSYHSSNVTLKNGVVDGSNAPTGICIMFEGSHKDVSGGLVENVEARNCGGCFSAYPQKGNRQKNNVCAAPICPSWDTPRGGKVSYLNLWTAGDNHKYEVFGEDVQVESS